jgi:hypothetical protein
MRLKIHHLAFRAARKGEAPEAAVRRSRSRHDEALLFEPLARTQNKPFALNPVNRRIRTRMYGGVGGRSREAPPIPIVGVMLGSDAADLCCQRFAKPLMAAIPD